jgi:F0F1-type ATP synthase alpha subunit
MAVQSGVLDRVPLERVGEFRAALAAALDRDAPEALGQIDSDGKLDDAGEAILAAALERIADRFGQKAEDY